MAKKLPAEVLEYFRKQGAKGGRIGGKRSLETMTPEKRSERARNAAAAREAKRGTTGKKWHHIGAHCWYGSPKSHRTKALVQTQKMASLFN